MIGRKPTASSFTGFLSQASASMRLIQTIPRFVSETKEENNMYILLFLILAAIFGCTNFLEDGWD